MALLLQNLSGRALGGHLVNSADGLLALRLLLRRAAFVQTPLKVCDSRFQLFHAAALAVHRLEQTIERFPDKVAHFRLSSLFVFYRTSTCLFHT
jgi:hypothetical protein